jgi:hypothetical protein
MAGRFVPRINAASGACNDSFRKELAECWRAAVHTERDLVSGNAGELAVRCGADYQGSAIEGPHCVSFFICESRPEGALREFPDVLPGDYLN